MLFERWDDLAMQSQEKDWRRAEQDNRQSRLAEMSDECSSRSSSKGSEEEVRVKANGGWGTRLLHFRRAVYEQRSRTRLRSCSMSAQARAEKREAEQDDKSS